MLSANKLLIRSDSQLVVGQVNAEYESRDPRMAKYVALVKQRLAGFSTWKLEHVSSDSNKKADALAAVAASLPITETIFLHIYYQPDSTIAIIRVNQVVEPPLPRWTLFPSKSTRENSLTRRIRLTRFEFNMPDFP